MEKNKKLKVAFDVDDCLIIPSVATGAYSDTPNYEVINIYKWFQSLGCHMIVWSGSGIDWAQTWSDKLGLNPDEVIEKKKHMVILKYPEVGLSLPQDPIPLVDIAFDDCDVDLAKTNIKVKRINNNVSRLEWNKTKRPDNRVLEVLQDLFEHGHGGGNWRRLITEKIEEVKTNGEKTK